MISPNYSSIKANKLKKGLSLQKIWDAFDVYTGKVSDISRQLSFAGIAIIWIFKTGDIYKPEKEDWFLWPLGLFVLTLAIDLLQYITGSLTWLIYARIKEKEQKKISGGIDLDKQYDPPDSLLWPLYFFFWLKTLTIIAGYMTLMSYVKLFLMS